MCPIIFDGEEYLEVKFFLLLLLIFIFELSTSFLFWLGDVSWSSFVFYLTNSFLFWLRDFSWSYFVFDLSNSFLFWLSDLFWYSIPFIIFHASWSLFEDISFIGAFPLLFSWAMTCWSMSMMRMDVSGIEEVEKVMGMFSEWMEVVMPSMEPLGLSFLVLLMWKEACTSLTTWQDGLVEEIVEDTHPSLG
jgi:hypothetical protein